MKALRWRSTCLLVSVALAASLTGCQDRARGALQVGLTRDQSTGEVAAVLYPCPGQRVEDAHLWLLNRKGSKRERLLWHVTADDQVTRPIDRLTLGKAPEGFSEQSPMAEAIPRNRRLEFNITMGRYVGINFWVKDVKSDALLVDQAWFGGDSHVGLDRFREVNSAECSHADK